MARRKSDRSELIAKNAADLLCAGKPTRSPIRRNRSAALVASDLRSTTIGVFALSVSSDQPSAVAAASSSPPPSDQGTPAAGTTQTLRKRTGQR
jgi:hypothetical protein